MPLALSDDELDAVMTAAQPLKPCDRDPFLRALAQELSHYQQLGPGLINKVARNLQRQFFDPPDLSGGSGKYG